MSLVSLPHVRPKVERTVIDASGLEPELAVRVVLGQKNYQRYWIGRTHCRVSGSASVKPNKIIKNKMPIRMESLTK